MKSYKFEDLDTADLIVDAIYESKRDSNPFAGEPLNKLITRIGNRGGFYKKRGRDGGLVGLVLKSTGDQPDWPDELDPYTGIFTYYGDNKHPGKSLTDTKRKGNLDLEYIFNLAHGDKEERSLCPLILVFEKYNKHGDYAFRGLAVPGSEYLFRGEDLIAIWRSAEGERFQNYKAKFTILDVNQLDGNWVREVFQSKTLDLEDSRFPKALKIWMEEGKYLPLTSTPISITRSKNQQLPTTEMEKRILATIYESFKDNPYGFEKIAAEIWKMSNQLDSTYDLTPHFRDGGRDATGSLLIGPKEDRIRLTFALEAKCYSPNNSVGVKETSRLISRIKHRELGVLVTTSYLDSQAYKEIRLDGHPVVVISGLDIVKIIQGCGLTTPAQVKDWLNRI